MTAVPVELLSKRVLWQSFFSLFILTFDLYNVLWQLFFGFFILAFDLSYGRFFWFIDIYSHSTCMMSYGIHIAPTPMLGHALTVLTVALERLKG